MGAKKEGADGDTVNLIGTGAAPANEPKNIVNNIKYTLDLPILHDNDLEVDEWIATCEDQLSNANNGKGVNQREVIHFMRQAIAVNSIRRSQWDLKVKEWKREGTFATDLKASYDKLLGEMRQVIPETPLSLIHI